VSKVDFEKQLTLLRQHARDLQPSPAEVEVDEGRHGALRLEVFEQSFSELSAGVEALQVAEEELRQQAEALQMANQALEVEQQHYQDLFNFAPDGYLVTTTTGTIMEANQAASELLHVAPEDLIGKPVTDLVPLAARPNFRSQLARAVDEDLAPRLTWRWDVLLQPADDPPVECEVKVGVVRDETGVMVALRWMARDVSKRKKTEARLRQSREQLRALTSHTNSMREEEHHRIAREIHDQLGGVLTALKMDLAQLRRGLRKDQPALIEKTMQMSQLLDETVQAVRRITTDLRPSLLDDFGLVEALEWQLGEFENRTHIACRLIAQGEAGQALAPEAVTDVFRIFQEILTNIARHATATRVEVTLDEREQALWLVVKDNGRGITEDELHSSTALGLLSMRERALPWGGELEIQGVPGAGTSVTLQLPLRPVRGDKS
jgi:PAS domain S-box-containing protein